MHTHRAEARAALQSEMEQAVAEARASASKEARHQVVTELREKLQRERSKFEADIVDLYRRRLKEVGW